MRGQRLLLTGADPVSSLRKALAEVLRTALKTAHASLRDACADGLASLESSETWSRLSATDRSAILTAVGLTEPAPIDLSTDTALLGALESRSIPSWKAEADAVSGRVGRALEKAARILEPEVRPLLLERATLKSEADVRRWIERQQATLSTAIKIGPVLVS